MLCKRCKKIVPTAILKICVNCGKTSDTDPLTRKYCRQCARRRKKCRGCGKKTKN